MSVIKEGRLLSIVLPTKDEVKRGKCCLCGNKEKRKGGYGLTGTTNHVFQKVGDACVSFLHNDTTTSDLCVSCNTSIYSIIRTMERPNIDLPVFFGNPKLPSAEWLYELYDPVFHDEVKEFDEILNNYYKYREREIDENGLPDEYYNQVGYFEDIVKFKGVLGNTYYGYSAQEEIDKLEATELAKDATYIDLLATQFILNMFNREKSKLKG